MADSKEEVSSSSIAGRREGASLQHPAEGCERCCRETRCGRRCRRAREASLELPEQVSQCFQEEAAHMRAQYSQPSALSDVALEGASAEALASASLPGAGVTGTPAASLSRKLIESPERADFGSSTTAEKTQQERSGYRHGRKGP